MAKKLTKKEQEQKDLREVVDRLLAASKLPAVVNVKDFCLLFWTQEEYDAVQVAREVVAGYQLDRYAPPFHRHVIVEHPVYPEPISSVFMFDITDNNRKTLWPDKRNAVRPGADINVVRQLDEQLCTLVTQAMDRGIIKDVCDFLINNATSHMQARYVFPPYLQLLRRADMGEIAHEIEQIKRPPPSLPMTQLMRKKIRWANEWFAMQELLGGFKKWEDTTAVGEATVTIEGNHTVEMSGSDGPYWVSFK